LDKLKVYRQYLENHYYIRVVSESCVFVQYFQFRDLVWERFQFFCWAEISIWCNMSLSHLFTDSGTLHLVLNKVKSSWLSVTTVLCMQSPLRWALPLHALQCQHVFSSFPHCRWASIARPELQSQRLWRSSITIKD